MENISIPGFGGAQLRIETVTLASGAGTVGTNLQKVLGVFFSQAGATAAAEGYSWTATGGAITIDSSNGSSTAVLTVLIIGF